jgi:hypothetical protein
VDLVAMLSALMCAASALIRHRIPPKRSAHEHSMISAADNVG